MIVAFIVIDLLIRYFSKRMRDAREQKERMAALDIGLRLDFTHEAKSLKRVEVARPLARILAVDDEPIVLDSFRKILVAAGYAIDTVESGPEALGLVQRNKYDFVFTDLKMPDMDGVDVVKGAKHFSPESDVVVITGHATIESAVNAMKFGAMDYVQKPFTEDELVEFTRKCLIRRQDRLQKGLAPTVRVVTTDRLRAHEFRFPAGMFISEGHVWVSVTVPGTVRLGMDDFARKMIGHIDAVELPAEGVVLRKGDPLFSVRQRGRTATFKAPVSGVVQSVNSDLTQNLDWLERHTYENGWVCSMKPAHLAEELAHMNIGEKASAWYQLEVARLQQLLTPATEDPAAVTGPVTLVEGQLEDADDGLWARFAQTFLRSQPAVPGAAVQLSR
jgi:CheY-like chemotaxis protein